VKFPNPRFDWWRQAFEVRKSLFSFVIGSPARIYDALLYGLIANISEAMVWRLNSHAKFLVPVFTLGLLNFQRYVGEKKPTHEDMIELWKKLPEDLSEILFQSSCHEYGWYNWRKTENGLKLIDYASNPLVTPWARFINKAHRVLDPLTAKK
jgi:hypothetical protein